MKAFLITIAALFIALPAQAETFKGYPCTKDCSGHKAGYEWAQRKGITDPSVCSGNSNSFVEGCIAAAQESFDPNAIAPAAGGDMPAAPSAINDPFALEPFNNDPFAPNALPGIGH